MVDDMDVRALGDLEYWETDMFNRTGYKNKKKGTDCQCVDKRTGQSVPV